MIAKSITELIGNTPLLLLSNYDRIHKLDAKIIVKIEAFNPGGSVKDRAALNMINDAESKGIIRPGDTIIEPTSGNTGVGLALVAAARGYKLILTMPETMSIERRKLLAALGAKIVLTPGAEGMPGSIKEAERLRDDTPGSVILQQFSNPANPEAHFLTTGPEIWKQTDGKVDIFVAGVGTGGTVSGIGRYLKSKNPDIKVVGVEPAESPIITEGRKGPHKIQGIGAGFVPDNFDRNIVDEVITIPGDTAIATSRELATCEGLLVGISSGAAVAAATLLAQRPENKGKLIVALLPDTGERYLSTELFNY